MSAGFPFLTYMRRILATPPRSQIKMLQLQDAPCAASGLQTAVSCNRCHTPVDGIGYRTACFHLFCPTCATQSFADGVTCSVCSTVLSKGDVKELTIGVSSQLSTVDVLLQIAYCDPQAESMIANLHQIRMACADVEQFVCTQLLHDANRQLEGRKQEMREKSALEQQMAELQNITRENEEIQLYKLGETESILKQREKDLSELKDAYKEKHRKCQAWEKAYNNIRDQVIVAGGGTEAVTSSSFAAPPAPQHHQSTHQQQPPQSQSQHRQQTVPPTGRPPGQQPLQPSPSQHHQHQDPPARSFRRTEVTTYSKTVDPQQYHQQLPPQSEMRQIPSVPLRTHPSQPITGTEARWDAGGAGMSRAYQHQHPPAQRSNSVHSHALAPALQHTRTSYESPNTTASGITTSPLQPVQPEPWAAPRLGDVPVREAQRGQMQYKHTSAGTVLGTKRARPFTFESPGDFYELPQGSEGQTDPGQGRGMAQERYVGHRQPPHQQAHLMHTQAATPYPTRQMQPMHYKSEPRPLSQQYPPNQQQQQPYQQPSQTHRSFFDN